MRIIGGKASKTKLYTLEGQATRPTLDRVKESLFNILQPYIYDSIFLDMFSGSGSIGLEAVSRGAKKAILCDNSTQAIKIIEKNIEKTHLENNVEVHKTSYENLLKSKIREKPDIIYIDPPYDSNHTYNALKLILQHDIAKPETIMIIETDRDNEILEQIKRLEIKVTDNRKYGRAHLIFLKLENKA